MSTVLATFICIAIVITIMAVGVLFGRSPIQGTCGGLNKMTGSSECSFCGGNRQTCESRVLPHHVQNADRMQPRMFDPTTRN